MAKRKVKHTYNDLPIISGLLCIFFGVLFFISFILNVENQSNIFYVIRSLFGFSSLFTSIFLVNLGLRLLGIKTVFNSTATLCAQLIFVFTLPALLVALHSGDREIIRSYYDVRLSGGIVGRYILVDLLGENLPSSNVTRLLLFVVNLIVFPFTISISLSRLFNVLSKILRNILNLFIDLDRYSKISSDVTDVKNVSTFGDLNKLRDKEKSTNYIQVSYEEPKDSLKQISKKVDNTDNIVDTKEKELAVGDKSLSSEILKYPNWKFPPLSLLIPFKKNANVEPNINQNARIIEQTLFSFGIDAKVENIYIGPSVVQYALNLPLGTKVEKVIGLSANLALALGVDSKSVRIDSIPDTTFLGIEVPRSIREMVRFKEMMSSDEMQNTKFFLPVPIGKDITGRPVIADIQKMPHLLIAGATGSGKSVLTNCFINSLIMKKTPDELRLILVDPKQVEFIDYNGIAHLLHPVITEMHEAVSALYWAVEEMERRYSLLASEQVRNIESYNAKKGFAAMPYIVIVIDEMADMMMTADRLKAETCIVRLAQKARAVGIHLILATQRPSVNVITGLIKANIPGRIAMSVTSSTDSRVILDRIGAESLMGKGDLLYKAPDTTKARRLQCSNIEQQEILRVVEFIREQAPEVEYLTEITQKNYIEDDKNIRVNGGGGYNAKGTLLEQAIRIVVSSGKGSSSYLQRRLGIGFNKAANLLEELEELGVVGPANGSKPREVLISDAEEFISRLRNS
ncbi:MAG: DNA translocase FtsK [Candidatus Dojkabacteria bacterium]|nr:DNA translocase FtsK [Candidatus Dojkabacteria bacterium]